MHNPVLMARCCRVALSHSGAAWPRAGDAHLLFSSPFHIQNPHTDAWKSQGLAEVASYCAESRDRNQWVPYVCLQER